MKVEPGAIIGGILLGNTWGTMLLRCLAFAFIFSTSVALMAQAPAAQPAAKQTTDATQPPITKIIKKTQLVYVPVVVNDKHGRHIGGLGKDLFDVEQDGKAQTIAVFEEIQHSDAVSRAKATFPAGSGYVENYSSSNKDASKLMIVILDTLNTPFLRQIEARNQLLDFLGRSLQVETPVSLMVLTSNGLRQVHPFTSDTRVLMEAVKKVSSQSNIAEMADADLERAIGDPKALNADNEADFLITTFSTAQFDRFVQMDAARTTIRALEQLAGAYQGIAGRKTVVWATGGFPFMFADPQSLNGLGPDFLDDYNRAFDLLNNANMAIYAVDVNGLFVNSLVSPTQANATPGGQASGAPINMRIPRSIAGAPSGGLARGAPRYDLAQQKQDALRAFADATGGKVFLNSNDFTKAFEAAAEDGSAYYVVGYYLKGNDKPGWHKLKVKVNTPHADVRAREGFLVPSPKNETPQSHLVQLGVATLSPADYTGVHFGVQIEKSIAEPAVETAGAAAQSTPVAMRSQPFHLAFPVGVLGVDADQNNLVSLDVLAVAFTKNRTDKDAGERVRGVRAHLKPEALAEFQKSGLGLEERIDLPPGEYDLRIAVRDNVSGNLGSVRTHIVVQ